MAALPHTASSHSAEFRSSFSSIILDSWVVSRLICLTRHALDLLSLRQLFFLDSIQKVHSLSLGYFRSSRSPSPRCTMPILCWAVCSAYFIHETMRNVYITTPPTQQGFLSTAFRHFFPPSPNPPIPPPPSAVSALQHPASFIFHLWHQLPQHDYPPPENPSLMRRQTWVHNLKFISASLPLFPVSSSLCYGSTLSLSLPYFLAPW